MIELGCQHRVRFSANQCQIRSQGYVLDRLLVAKCSRISRNRLGVHGESIHEADKKNGGVTNFPDIYIHLL